MRGLAHPEALAHIEKSLANARARETEPESETETDTDSTKLMKRRHGPGAQQTRQEVSADTLTNCERRTLPDVSHVGALFLRVLSPVHV